MVNTHDLYIYNMVHLKKSVVIAITSTIRKRLNYIHYFLFVNTGKWAMYLRRKIIQKIFCTYPYTHRHNTHTHIYSSGKHAVVMAKSLGSESEKSGNCNSFNF